MADAVPGAQAPAAAGPPKVPAARNDPQARIDELAAQKAHFQQKAQKFENEQQRLREELAALKGQLAAQAPAPAPKGTPKTWGEMSDDQLEEARRYARTNDQPDVLDSIYEEKMNRAAERARKAAVEEAGRKGERAQLLRDVHSRILEDFGQEAFNPESPLYQGAERYLAEQRRIYGDASAGEPHRLYDAFAHSERNTRVLSERERLKALEQENQALKDRASLAERAGAIGSNARAIPDAVKEALKAGKTRDAIKATGTAQSIAAEIRRNLLPRRS